MELKQLGSMPEYVGGEDRDSGVEWQQDNITAGCVVLVRRSVLPGQSVVIGQNMVANQIMALWRIVTTGWTAAVELATEMDWSKGVGSNPEVESMALHPPSPIYNNTHSRTHLHHYICCRLCTGPAGCLISHVSGHIQCQAKPHYLGWIL